jgi:hypothetical protein
MNKVLKYLILLLSLIFILLLSLTFVFRVCDTKSSKTSISVEYNNDVFTENLYNSLNEIDFFYGGDEIIIDNEDMYNIFSKFASLTLSDASDIKEYKDGQLIIKMVTKDKIINIGLLSGEIGINAQLYLVDKDIVDEVRKIALKYQK